MIFADDTKLGGIVNTKSDLGVTVEELDDLMNQSKRNGKET